MNKKTVVVLLCLGSVAVLYFCIRFFSANEDRSPGGKAAVEKEECLRRSYAVLSQSEFLSPEAGRLIAEACWSCSKESTLYHPVAVSAREIDIEQTLVQGKYRTYIEIVTDDETHLFFLIPNYKSPKADIIEEIWRDHVGIFGVCMYFFGAE